MIKDPSQAKREGARLSRFIYDQGATWTNMVKFRSLDETLARSPDLPEPSVANILSVQDIRNAQAQLRQTALEESPFTAPVILDSAYPKEPPPEQMYRHCNHMRNALPRRAADRAIEETCTLLSKLDFDTIAFRGISGTVMAPIIAYKMQKEMILVRKNNGNGCASGKWVEGFCHAKRYVVLDDLVCSGNSVKDTMLATMVLTHNHASCIGLLLYDDVVQLVTPGQQTEWGITFDSLLEAATERYRVYRSIHSWKPRQRDTELGL